MRLLKDESLHHLNGIKISPPDTFIIRRNSAKIIISLSVSGVS